ncbi:unnamed protein product [Allacma fusca]|uniref:SWIM-type domain-containing protein n=1 Tax=Allacma fusca TaxID=39272 RepID=A0A8J2KI01_9HEXA|nr:unnamed protein product [Allacma fusca]
MAGQVRLRDQFAALERAMRDWELVDSDRFSFEDSDRFEEDSLCSWISEPESLCNNWRGWKKSTFSAVENPAPSNACGTSGNDPGVNVLVNPTASVSSSNSKKPDHVQDVNSKRSNSCPHNLNLVELSARLVASHIPFEMVEKFSSPVPEQLQLRIAFWSFPENEEDIRLYSCLANGSAEEFQKGERLFRSNGVSDILQIGFHLSATVKPNMREAHKVTVTFDRRRVISCTCTCNASTNWCGHVVAVCLHRIIQSKDVVLRAPVSESLSRLHREQLQKFAQYLISELPHQILPTAQRLLDELLSSQDSAINTLRGAPDPTAGASANEQTTWYLDERTLHGNIHKILIKFCVPAPIVFSDVNYLSSAAPPASAEWSSLLRPVRGREPEGMWNLLSIVREMFRREDRNAIPLLEIITEECLNCDQILVWWFNTKVALHNGNAGHGGKHHSVNSNAHACQHAGASLCDEIVFLWRLAALNPGLSPEERCILHKQFKEWHLKIIEKVSKSRNASVGSKQANSFKNDVEVFPGFRPSIEACYLNWENYPIVGVTYSESNLVYHCPFMCFRHSDRHSRSGETGMIHSSHAILNNPVGEHHLLHSSATISSVPLGSKRPRSVEFGNDQVLHANFSAANSSLATSTQAAGPSTSVRSGKNGKSGNKLREREALAANLNICTSSSPPILPIGASGLKIKTSRQLSLEPTSSFDDETPGPSSSSPPHRSRLPQADAVAQNVLEMAAAVPGPRDGDRSSISSEGFCEHEMMDDEGEILRDEGVVIDASAISAARSGALSANANISLSSSIPISLDSTGQMSLSSSTQLSLSSSAQIGLGESTRKSLSASASDELENEADIDADSDSSTSARVCPVLPTANLPSKLDSSDSQQSGDEYQLYYYDTKTAIAPGKRGENSNKEGADADNPLGFNVFANVKKIEDPWDILFARAEGLHAHGHSKDACVLGVKLAGELLANPPDLTLETPVAPVGKGKKRKNNPASHQISCLASATLAKCGFLCTVLAENPEFYYLAFQVGMFGLELARPPASTKPLEVKLANQEAELAQLLKKISIGQKELEMIREKAEGLRDGKFKSRGDALLPLVFANFIFDALVMPANREGRCSFQSDVYHVTSDETLGFEAAVAALGLKANVSEAEHPLLCEGTRRQRGDLALAMLLHYKDQPEKLSKVMDKLLDRDIHQLYKAPLPASYYSNNPPTTTLLGASWANRNDGSTDSLSVDNSLNIGSEGNSPSTLTPQAHHSKANTNEPTVSPTSETANSSANTATNTTAEAALPNTTNGSAEGVATTSTGSSGTGTVSKGRFKGKRNYPVLPNQPSEAGAHFMFELAKIVLGKAGGSSNQSLFTQPSTRGNPRGPHRALHMCAFHIGLYALGLHNAVSPNWLSRTYSSHQTWIMGQAMEIGAPAIAFLIDTWDSHLTPAEAVTIADRASRGDVNMVRAAAELALSCLPHAHALNINEIHRAILQCKEQSDGMLEKACMIVEASAKGGGVYPEVLFDVARQWYSLYQKHLPLDVDLLHEEMNHSESLGSLDVGVDSMNPHISGNQGSINQVGQHLVPSSIGGSAVANPVEMLGLPPPGPALSHQQQPVYPLAAPQVPMASIPFAASPYGQVPFLPAAFNPVPGNFVYGPTVIYQASLANNPSVSTTASGYYSQQAQQAQSQQMSYGGAPSLHQQPIHSIVSAGQALQYYPSVSPITSTGPTHLRPNAQFFPVSNMSVHPAHANSRNNIPIPNGTNVTAVMAAGHSFLPPSHGHKLNVNNQGHLVTITSASNSNCQSISVDTNMAASAAASHNQHSAALAAHSHNIAIAGARTSGLPQVNRGATIVSHGNNNFAIGGILTSQAQPMSQHPCINSMGALEGPPNSASSQPRSALVFSQGGREFSGQQGGQTSAIKIKYLYAAYRVGMLALETLARRVHDDRPAAKFARNPPYGEDVKWLLSISRKLGTQYLQQFCICAVSSIANPFVLHEIILDAAFISSRNNLAWVYQNPRSPLSPLVQKCQQMYFQCLHQKLYHITLSDYEDFVSIVCTARQAFHLTPDGNSQFKEWLQNLRRSKACKKDLWAQITAALQSNPK